MINIKSPSFESLEQIYNALENAHSLDSEAPLIELQPLAIRIDNFLRTQIEANDHKLSDHNVKFLVLINVKLQETIVAIQNDKQLSAQYMELFSRVTTLCKPCEKELNSYDIQPHTEIKNTSVMKEIGKALYVFFYRVGNGLGAFLATVCSLGFAYHTAAVQKLWYKAHHGPYPKNAYEPQNIKEELVHYQHAVNVFAAEITTIQDRQTVPNEDSVSYNEHLDALDQLKTTFGAEEHIARPALKEDLNKKFMGMPIHSAKAWITEKIKSNAHPRRIYRYVAKKLGMPVSGQSKYEYASIMIQGLAFYKANRNSIQEKMLSNDISNTDKQNFIAETLGFAYHPNQNDPKMSVRMLEDFLEVFESHYENATKQARTDTEAMRLFFDKFFNNSKVCLEDRYRHLNQYASENPLLQAVDLNATSKEWDDELPTQYPDDKKEHKFNKIFGWELMEYIAAYKKHDTTAGPHWAPTGTQFKEYLETKKDIYNIEAPGEELINGHPPKFTAEILNKIISEYVDDCLLEE